MNSHVLAKSFYCNVVVSRLADEIARELIAEFYIKALNNLAFLLDGTVLMNDHQILRLWTQKMIDLYEQEYLIDELKMHIRLQFMRLVRII
ncbi:hypothetical protein GCM10023206_21120 [Acinetobacter puyangensis]|uniref:Uncharacterized protein n=1 Tax=Acinetobacter puyangensis TaxID=1096779 RepID=A0A240ED11_9GAMM|nr:hypothetical protein [Acinetobacter puyangensis]SNX46582.1 hypothetical protein SAMN05421731_11368 [Acinetobacter puyangensis]